MKDDYLWDKTGEPDPEIQHMERVLGQLRHRRTAQDLPAFEIRPRKEPRSYYRMLAIAAALVFAILSVGVAAVLLRQSQKQDENNHPLVMVNPAPSQPVVAPNDAPSSEADRAAEQNNPIVPDKASEKRSDIQSTVARRRNISRSREAIINEREQAQGQMAKEQLIKALQITSSKLDFVQKKVRAGQQGPSS